MRCVRSAALRKIFTQRTQCAHRTLKAKFHYTGPTAPDRTRTDFVGDLHGPTEFLGDPKRSGPRGSGRARVVEFSYKQTHALRLAGNHS